MKTKQRFPVRRKKALYTLLILVGAAVGSLSFAIAQDTTIYDRFEVAPEPIGGRVAYLQWLDKTIQIPDTAYSAKAGGEALLEFVVEPNGELSHIQVSSKLGAATEEAVRKAVAGSTRWRSPMINGRPVRARHQMGIRVHPDSSSAEAIVFSDSVEVTAEPRGGHAAFRQWIGSNYRYPHEAVEQSVRGTLKLRFIVEKDGSLTQVEILNGLGYGTGEEAIRVLKRSPLWKPALITGKPVRSYFILPIMLVDTDTIMRDCITLVSWGSVAGRRVYNYETFQYLEEHQALYVFTGRGNADEEQRNKAAKVQRSSYGELRYRTPMEIPTEVGFCINEGLIRTSTPNREEYTAVMRIPEYPEVVVALESYVTNNPGDFSNRGAIPLGLSVANLFHTKTLKNQSRSIGEAEGREYLTRSRIKKTVRSFTISNGKHMV